MEGHSYSEIVSMGGGINYTVKLLEIPIQRVENALHFKVEEYRGMELHT